MNGEVVWLSGRVKRGSDADAVENYLLVQTGYCEKHISTSLS